MLTGSDRYIPPRDQIEKKLVQTWSRVLDLPARSIGIDDNFFKLGGHSLKVANLAAKLDKELDVKLTFIEVFKSPTIKELAEHIR